MSELVSECMFDSVAIGRIEIVAMDVVSDGTGIRGEQMIKAKRCRYLLRTGEGVLLGPLGISQTQSPPFSLGPFPSPSATQKLSSLLGKR